MARAYIEAGRRGWEFFMSVMNNSAKLLVLASAAALVLSGCSTSRFGGGRVTRQPAQLQPISNSQVQSQNLPPIGQNGSQIGIGFNDSADPSLLGQTTNADGTLINADGVSTLPNTSGRDMSGGVSVAKLLGAWTVIAGADRCQINLTQTTKSGTNRYRASAPTCNVPALSLLSSWRLAGNQVQFYDSSGAIIGSLLQNDQRFVGTLAGGIAVSMVG